MLYFSTKKSLLLIDEYGKGTNPIDGVSLLLSCLEYLGCKTTEDKKPAIPLTICVTHFHRYVRAELYPTTNLFHKHQMSVTFTPHDDKQEASQKKESLKPIPLFKITPGTASGSFGIECAVMSGLSLDVTKRAQDLLSVLSDNNTAIMKRPKVKLLDLQKLVNADWESLEGDDIRNMLLRKQP